MATFRRHGQPSHKCKRVGPVCKNIQEECDQLILLIFLLLYTHDVYILLTILSVNTK